MYYFRSCRWGSLLPICASLTVLLVPQWTWVEMFCHTCWQSHLQSSPQTPQKANKSFWNPKTFENRHLYPAKYNFLQICQNQGSLDFSIMLHWSQILGSYLSHLYSLWVSPDRSQRYILKNIWSNAKIYLFIFI
jgi:hypothetical protein